MSEWLRLVGPSQALEIAGIKLVGVTAENGRKLVATLLFVAILWLVARIVHGLAHATLQHRKRLEFWSRQFVRIATTIVAVVGLGSIWFDDPGRATAALGLFTAGLAFALQRVVTAFAGDLVILRGATFNFVRLTDNWNELSIRFLTSEHGVRDMKDRMSREILAGLTEAGIQVASATFEIVGLPTLRLARASSRQPESA